MNKTSRNQTEQKQTKQDQKHMKANKANLAKQNLTIINETSGTHKITLTGKTK